MEHYGNEHRRPVKPTGKRSSPRPGRVLPHAALAVLLAAATPASPPLPAEAPNPIGLAQVGLEPVLSGLSQPVLATSARDGTNRLFVVEQPGRIKVLRPGASSAAVFLDISSKLLSGGERGLLGLTFHPGFRSNRRFFVNYTRRPDGATVVAEYRASASDADVAAPEETVLLTIPQPFSNHNGGMVEFGPDGYLYIGMGDGGSANDPGDRAQNLQELLGKMLRIDVDRTEGELPYGIPPDNPLAAAASGRREIFALGLRNPWRFSFDRATGLLYAGDVGQNVIEEIDVIRAGGNYGWRVLEGTRCTGLGPGSCTAGGFLPPIAEYSHAQGRCSVTGGYVYRGSRGSLPSGAYVFGDYCTGEIFLLRGGTQAVLKDTDLNITSFGEDEEGEIYVVGQGGTVHRIINPEAPAAGTYYFPRLVTTGGRPPGRDESTGVAVSNLDSSPATLTFTAIDRDGRWISDPGVTNPRSIELSGGSQLARLDTELFGTGLQAHDRLGWIRLESTTRRLAAFFLAFDADLSLLDGSDVGSSTVSEFVLPEVEAAGFTDVHLANPGTGAADALLELCGQDGSVRARAARTVPAGGALAESCASLFPGTQLLPTDYVRGSASRGVVPLEFLGISGRYARVLNALDATAGARYLYGPQYATGGGYQSSLSICNLDTTGGTVSIRLIQDDGTQAGRTLSTPLPARGKLLIADSPGFGEFGTGLTQGYVEIRTSGIRVAGSVTFLDSAGSSFAAALPLAVPKRARLVFSQAASDAEYFTGIAVVNPGPAAALVRIDASDSAGSPIASGAWTVAAGGRISRLLTEFFPALAGRAVRSGIIRVTADQPVAGFALFGTNNLTALSAIPPTVVASEE